MQLYRRRRAPSFFSLPNWHRPRPMQPSGFTCLGCATSTFSTVSLIPSRIRQGWSLSSKGIQRIRPRQGKPRLPIMPIILGWLKSSLDLSPGYDSTMLWAVCCLGFFGFLRCGEFTVASGASFDRANHLAFQDISVDSHSEPTVLAVRIKASKTDQFGKGMTIFLGKAPSNLCPVTAVLSYIAI